MWDQIFQGQRNQGEQSLLLTEQIHSRKGSEGTDFHKAALFLFNLYKSKKKRNPCRKSLDEKRLWIEMCPRALCCWTTNPSPSLRRRCCISLRLSVMAPLRCCALPPCLPAQNHVFLCLCLKLLKSFLLCSLNQTSREQGALTGSWHPKLRR